MFKCGEDVGLARIEARHVPQEQDRMCDMSASSLTIATPRFARCFDELRGDERQAVC